ncbi:MAG: N-acetylgalactosamine 6-sulfate sulfatase [Opitutus sp.]|nr:N-acetylgalactosamine 6-sulfate sulfatase [Opitutus sp.]
MFLVSAALAADRPPTVSSSPPNIVIIFTDDQGYGDLGCFGATAFRTPRIDRLAVEGTRFTNFYAQLVCGPSRSALLTGRQPVRSGGWSMPASEITFAELLRQKGYATACLGKWDVSNRAAIPDRMPNAKGFDYFYGALGANDGGRVVLHENHTRVGETTDMGGLTRTYTDKAIAFLRSNRDKPFLLYLAHTMVHSVVGASPEFRGKSQGGLYGDAIEELDFHTGRLLDALDELRLRDTTLVIFTSDNGPWSNNQENLRSKHGGEIAWGSSGPLREAKGSSYEGGSRVPCLIRWPGRVPAGRVSDAIFSTLDFLPTFGTLAGFEPPRDRLIEGVDQTELLLGRSERGARDHFHYFCQNELHGVRQGPWKLLLPNRKVFYAYVKDRGTNEPELYHLATDPGETKNVARDHPDVVERLLAFARSYPWPEKLFEAQINLPGPAAGQLPPVRKNLP